MYSKKHRILAVVVSLISAVLFWTSSQAYARVIITERTTFYNVSGKTGPQLFRSITRRGPRVSGVGHAIATTSSSLQVRNIKTSVRGRKCRIVSADVVLKLVYRYPRWQNQRTASARVRKNWERFAQQVRKHELKHGSISKKFARNLERQIKRISGRVSRGCRDFGLRSSRAIARLERNHARAHMRFDRRENRAFSRIRRLQSTLILSQ